VLTGDELLQPFRDPLPAQLGNMVECPFWILLGLAIGAMSLVRGRAHAHLMRQTCGVLVVFGLSDAVEVYTGVWWRPWWLLAWKAACILALLVLLRTYAKRQRQSAAKG
jgi:hypothetical protein